ncbi:zf-MIZ and/or PINIT domain containing protein, partial [Asbolus verrucosus]
NPKLSNKPEVEPKRPPRPVDITPMVKLSPIVTNIITISWASDYTHDYVISVALVQKLTSSDLLHRLKVKGAKHSDHTRSLIKEKLKEDPDSEITTTSLKVSLICPLGKIRMTTPCRANTCNHLQCFDSSAFLQMNECKPTWCCPICDKPALYDDLVIDGYFQEVLSSPDLPPDLNEIQLHKDGSWSTQVTNKKITKNEKPPINNSIKIICGDVDTPSPPSSPPAEEQNQ